jgi:uncharacterized protein (DUF1778 family)
VDDSTYLALRRAARSLRKTKEDFVCDAVVKAVREVEYEQIRLAYQKQPDSEAEADDWNSAEEFQSDPA